MPNRDDRRVDNIYQSKYMDFQDLMRYRIRDILLVSSVYDSYMIEDDARLYELIRNEYEGFHIAHTPEIRRVSTGEAAIELIGQENRFDLIITTLHIEDMHALSLAKQLRERGSKIPVMLLALDQRELADLLSHHNTSLFDRIFLWQGDYHLIIAMLSQLEDQRNVEHDTRVAGVQSILLVEDNVRFYSSYLPIIYTEVLNHSKRLIAEGVNLSHRYLRMRARPKILLSTTYEEAWSYFTKYQDSISGIISDVDFVREGKADPEAGIELARRVKSTHSDIPILLQSTIAANEQEAHKVGASFVLKDSPQLLHEVRTFMKSYFGFDDFVFRTPDGVEVGRASDLESLAAQLATVPKESIKYHAERNHFSNWLKARTEFGVAYHLRARKVSDYETLEDLRSDLIQSLHRYREEQKRGRITDFSKESFDPANSLARIGGGSLGGKARGLSFLNMLIDSSGARDRFPGVRVSIPPGVIVGTDVFDYFIERNGLRDLFLAAESDETTARRFLNASKFPRKVLSDLNAFLDMVRQPLAVRSSSLQEDSQYQPFAGIYSTFMIPNNHANPDVRLRDLLSAIKRVYASTYSQAAKEYTRHSMYRLEEEKMAVIIQKVVGSAHGKRFYPDFSGVAKSFNFYPMPPQVASDGITSVALGLGQMVVDGGASVTFCPKYPEQLFQFAEIDDAVTNSQRDFFAIDLDTKSGSINADTGDVTRAYPLSIAETDGTLGYVGSTYSPENESIHDGLSRQGTRLVTFAPILKRKVIPLPEILDMALDIGSSGMGSPVEIEFAVKMGSPDGAPTEFGLLQMRPLVVSRQVEELRLDKVDPKLVLCESSQVLGNGVLENIFDIVTVDFEKFDRSKTEEVALEVSQYNGELSAENKPYILIGVGRWGTLDPWLGIPVRWEHISGAKVIIETGFRDLDVTPSQGTHFFQNITAFMTGYFTINENSNQGRLDWQWLMSQKPLDAKEYTRHIRFSSPLVVKMNGHDQKGIILKPG
ncbi:MAG TPA: PEP/pyruvate-binding domain-containing protein [Bacteroidota bacterium]|nr:PEP/pyruvate-binding domain-containing protein [Bacteroidota bacterium]